MHVIKYEYADGVKLKFPVAWCGEVILVRGCHYQDATHYSMDTSAASACVGCLNAMSDDFWGV